MAEDKSIRLSMAARKLNVGVHTVVEFLARKGFSVEENPNTRLTAEQFALLSKEFAASASEKMEAGNLTIGVSHGENITIETEKEAVRKRKEEEEQILIKNLASNELPTKEGTKPPKIEREKPKLEGPKIVGRIDLDKKKEQPPEVSGPQPPQKETAPQTKEPPKEEKEKEVIKAKSKQLAGLKVLGTIDLPADDKKQKEPGERKGKRPRKRIEHGENARSGGKTSGRPVREEPSDREIQEQVRKTLAELTSGKKQTLAGQIQKGKATKRYRSAGRTKSPGAGIIKNSARYRIHLGQRPGHVNERFGKRGNFNLP
ncbi:MAG: hypothetical protein KatS3mg032_1335 [Cyclobacteriaceae bacterium]|nr:MAG: hypothetical protein KatS3mg032_1335 [Cyclobacteriaceae bacterium]